MAQEIYVRFPPDRERDFYFRVFCWAEELWPPIEGAGLGTIHHLTEVRETVHITVNKRSDLGTALEAIKKTLPRHFPHGEGTIERS